MPWSDAADRKGIEASNAFRILLVEDSLPILGENESGLHKAGSEVICAEDRDSAPQTAQERKPALILLDNDSAQNERAGSAPASEE